MIRTASARWAAVLTALAFGGAAAAADAPRQCFRSHDYQSFRTIDEHGFYIRVGVNDVYRIELEGSCPALNYPGARLITVVRGSDEICGPLDWDLRVGEPGPGGIATPCIVKAQSRLTPAEVAAIPRKLRP